MPTSTLESNDFLLRATKSDCIYGKSLIVILVCNGGEFFRSYTAIQLSLFPYVKSCTFPLLMCTKPLRRENFDLIEGGARHYR